MQPATLPERHSRYWQGQTTINPQDLTCAKEVCRVALVTELDMGTLINVSLVDEIGVDLAHAGLTFNRRVDDPVAVDARIVIPREASAAIQAVNPVHIQP